MEDKRRCPNCGHPLHRQPYVMSRDPNAEPVWTPRTRWVAVYLLLFMFLCGAFALVSHSIH